MCVKLLLANNYAIFSFQFSNTFVRYIRSTTTAISCFSLVILHIVYFKNAVCLCVFCKLISLTCSSFVVCHLLGLALNILS